MANRVVKSQESLSVDSFGHRNCRGSDLHGGHPSGYIWNAIWSKYTHHPGTPHLNSAGQSAVATGFRLPGKNAWQ